MATRLKGNKGYFTLLVTDSVWGTVLLGITLGLVDLPIAALTMAINLGVDIGAGVIMGPKKPHIKVRTAEDEVPRVRRGPIKYVKSFSKKWTSYIAAGFKDPDYVVGAASAGAGLNVFFQALLGIKTILTSHSLLLIGGLTGAAATGAIAGCAAVAAIGLFCIVAGKLDKWKGTNRFYAAVFKGGAPKEAPHENFAKKLARRPIISKVLNSKIARGTKKYLMIAMTAESSFFTIVASAAVITQRGASVIAQPHRLVTEAVPLFLAVRWGGGAVWHVISAGKIIVRDRIKKLQEKRHAKSKAKPAQDIDPALVFDSPAAEAAPASKEVPVPQPASANENTLPAQPLTAAFDGASGSTTAGKIAAQKAAPEKDMTRRDTSRPKL